MKKSKMLKIKLGSKALDNFSYTIEDIGAGGKVYNKKTVKGI